MFHSNSPFHCLYLPIGMYKKFMYGFSHCPVFLAENYSPCMGKCPQGKIFMVFAVFSSTVNLFLQIMALKISNKSLQKRYSESFTANSYFPLKTRKFTPMDVILYMVQYRLDIITEQSFRHNDTK